MYICRYAHILYTHMHAQTHKHTWRRDATGAELVRPGLPMDQFNLGQAELPGEGARRGGYASREQMGRESRPSALLCSSFRHFVYKYIVFVKF